MTDDLPARGGFLERAHSLLAWPRLPVVTILAALLLTAPSLGGRLISDDYIHQIRIRDDVSFPGFAHSWTDLFVFSSGDAAQRRLLMDQGILGWWSAEGQRLAFWRPLSALTHVVDHLVAGCSAVFMHAHSMVWFAGLLTAVALLYRRIYPPWIAGLALTLYALDDARGMVLSFVANRNALVAGLFAVSALVAHDRYRRDGSRTAAWLGPLLYGLSLMSGESGLSILGYFAAYALFMDRAPARPRLAALLPYALITGVYLAAYRLMGYGSHGSGVYQNPLEEPGAFLARVAEHLPVLLLGQFAGPPSDVWILLPKPAACVVYGLALVNIAILAILFTPLLRRQAVVRFWALGMLLATVPICATFPSDRLLTLVGVGAMGLIASLVAAALAPDESLPRGVSRRAARAGAAGLAIIHLIVAPLLLPVRTLTVDALAAAFDQADDAIPRTDDIRGRSLVVVSALADGTIAYIPPTRAALGVPYPRRLRILATGPSEVRVTRMDPQTLRIRPKDGFLSTTLETMARGRNDPVQPGYTVTLSDMEVVVREVTGDGRPAEVDFRFNVPLEDPSLLWMRADGLELVPFTPPSVGDVAVIPANPVGFRL